MKNWIPTNKFRKLVAVTALFAVVLYSASLFMVLHEIKKIESSYTDTESSASKEERSRLLKSIAENNKKEIQTLREFFIQKGDEVKFIEQIEEIGHKSDIIFEISAIDVKPGQSNPINEDVIVKMAIKGSWENVINFVNSLEKTYFGVSVQNLTLDADSPGKWSGLVEFIIYREK